MAKKELEISQEDFNKLVTKRVIELFNKSRFKNQDQLKVYLDNNPSSATISDIFNAAHNISAFKLMRILVALDGSADYVFFGKEHEQPATRENRKLLEEFEERFKKLLEANETRIMDIQDKQVNETINLIMGHKIINSDIWNAIHRFVKSNDHNKVQTVIRLIKYIF